MGMVEKRRLWKIESTRRRRDAVGIRKDIEKRRKGRGKKERIWEIKSMRRRKDAAEYKKESEEERFFFVARALGKENRLRQI